MIRNYGDAVEADLAFHAKHPADADLRNLWRRGSGLTLRRLNILISALPLDSLTRLQMEADHKKALKPTPDRIRERAEFYRRQRERQAAG